VDLLGRQAFVVSVVDLLQEVRELRVEKPGELSGPPGTYHRARKDSVELER
jgi:hypothetical protein